MAAEIKLLVLLAFNRNGLTIYPCAELKLRKFYHALRPILVDLEADSWGEGNFSLLYFSRVFDFPSPRLSVLRSRRMIQSVGNNMAG